MQNLTRQGMQLNAEMNNLTVERFNVAGALLAKLFGKDDEERDRFSTRAAGVRDIGVRTAIYGRILFVALGLVAAVGTAVVYFVGGNLAISGTITHGHRRRVHDLRRPDVPTARAAHELARRHAHRARVVRARVRGARLSGLDRRPARRGRPRRAARGASSSITCGSGIRRATRSRSPSLETPGTPGGDEPSEWILRDVSFRVEPGETVALVGPSGAGKTTIAMLVPRIYDVTQGAVRVDGHDVKDLTLETLHDAVGLVPQDPHLFHESIRANLLFADPDASDAEIEGRAARGAHLGSRRVVARRSRHRRRRTRLPHVGRREATARDRALAAQGSRDRDSRRSDVAPRLRVGARDPSRRSTRSCSTEPRS